MIERPYISSASAIREIERICPSNVLRGVPLSKISRWRIGGVADLVVRPDNIDQLARLRSWLYDHEVPHIVIGAMSNLLFADEGLRIPCIQIGKSFSDISIVGADVYAGAGAWVPGLARCVMQASLTGAEHTCGIPGTLGGLICMNGGSQRKGIGGSVIEVQSIDPTGCIVRRSADQCEFSYRHSVFQRNGDIITAVRLRFKSAPGTFCVRRDMLSILADRRRKFPKNSPNCGSVFVSDPSMYAKYGPPGAVIERLGLKGFRYGGAQVSPQHANFIVNTGGALAIDVLRLIQKIRAEVLASTGYAMSVEVRYVAPDGVIVSPDTVSIEIEGSHMERMRG